MANQYNCIAVDLGAESGRVMLARVADDALTIEQVHRFPNGPIEQDGTLRWEFERLFAEIKQGIRLAVQKESQIASIGVDTWGVDFGLLDKDGALIEDPYHYRDSRTNDMMDKACAILPREKIYANTGIQFMQFNTLFQVMALKEQHPEVLEKTEHMVFMANLIMYYLTGEISAEYSMASTSQMMDMNTGTWSDTIFKAFDLPQRIMPEVIQPGARAGVLKAGLAQELGCSQIPVVAVGTHDTASAVAAVPVTHAQNWAYLSSGTWSLMGIESPTPMINDSTCSLAYTNEGGVCNTIRVLKNIMGLWLVQESKRHWAKQGEELDYAEITRLATAAKPFQGVISTEHGEFFGPGDMPIKINRYLQSTGQPEIADKGQLVRVILESLGLRYCQVMNNLEDLSGHGIDVLHIVGGGIQNELLNQLTANATGKTVITGPIEATVIGNVLVQAMAMGHIDSMSAGRALVAKSFPVSKYTPEDQSNWESFKTKAKPILG
jgi:rhamnulokinase